MASQSRGWNNLILMLKVTTGIYLLDMWYYTMFIVNDYRAYICRQPKVVGRWQNIRPRRSRGPIFVTCPQLRAGGKNICPVIINNKRYCQFNHYYISYSAFFLQVYSDFKLAAEYENIRPQLAAEYFHIVRNLRPNISILSRNKLAILRNWFTLKVCITG